MKMESDIEVIKNLNNLKYIYNFGNLKEHIIHLIKINLKEI